MQTDKWTHLTINNVNALARKSIYNDLKGYVIISVEPKLCAYGNEEEDVKTFFEILLEESSNIATLGYYSICLPYELNNMPTDIAFFLNQLLTDENQENFSFLSGNKISKEDEEYALNNGWDLETVNILLEK